MICLYYMPGGANMVVHALLEHIGEPYELKPVNAASGENRSEEFLEFSPDGCVSVLTDGRLVMQESSAIALYLAGRFSDAGLVPEVDPNRSRYFLWMVLLANTVEEALLRWYHPEDCADGAEAQTSVKSQAEQRLKARWDRVDGALGERSYLLASALSAADNMLFMLCFWAGTMKTPLSNWDNIATWLQDMNDLDAIRAMISQEGFA
ncbi:MAG: glutathione S-transferase [Rhodospirillaceae bacterium]|nr:glutathione S-transferase [Rhodospirillaceae bacterium]